ncbi:small subunit processome component 20 homolog [Palaemon carinicauda]|uniref:small subunit processome component 20 homolog n=1 Tax=Palaemon carinicauda TaxID=392227 RepID=UPI0035B585F9
MKGKASRQSHKATNTFVFRGFGEKVRALRISARKYLLQRPQNTEGESTTFIYEAICKARELNVTQEFKAFLRELGNEVRTTSQLVLLENHIVNCISTHISIPETSALQPLCDILVAFANDLPQEFYNNHFYNILPKLIAHLSIKEPEVIETVFLCIVSLFVVLQKYLYDDFYTLYHVHNFCRLLSKSYPWYINELAAQSLGVLVRKIPKKNQFISVSLKKLKKDESQIQGLGRVFASMMKSDVIHRLHSCTPKILSKLLEALSGSDEVPQEPALETVKFAMSLVAKYITIHSDNSVPWQTLWKEDNALVWPTFWDFIKRLISQNDANTHHHLNCVLQVLNVFLSHKQGALITDVNDSVANCVLVLEFSLPDTVGYTMTEILATLLTIPEDRLSHSDFKRIIISFLSCNYSPAVKFSFVKQVLELERFDEEILPLLLPCLDCMIGKNEDPGVSRNIVELIADITVQKRPPCATGLELSTWSPYALNFTAPGSSEGSHIGQYIEREIKKGFSEDLSNLEDLSLCLLCLPHIMNMNYHTLTPYLSKILGNAMAMLKDEAQKVVDTVKPLKKKKKSEVPIPELSFDMNIKSDIPLVARQVLFLISLVVEVMSHTLSKENFLASLCQLKLIELLKKRHHYRENVHILRAVDIHFTVASSENQKNIINEEYLREIYKFLAPALASSNPQIRFLILHIFSLFPINLIPLENGDHVESVFQILLKAESVPITPFEFRDRLRFITMVDADHLKPHIPISGDYNEAPLLFLIGQLYTNYKDLWNPVLKTISGFAYSMPHDVFWPLWFSKLKIASHTTHEVLLRKQVDPEQDLHLSSSVIYDVDCKLTLHSGYSKLQPKPNHLNFRDLLWRAMDKFPDICENKNRDLVPLFFDFLEKEFFPVDFTVAPTQDITLQQRQQECVNNEGDDVSEQAEEGKEIGSQLEELEGDEDTAEYPKRASVKSLCEQLTLFSRFHNPRMLTQSKKLESMYLELLTHPSPALQKLSFDCLLGYNHSFLTPYKDHMYKLLEDKTFKNSLTLFSIDGSEKTLDDEHRKDFMPYLMRVLYGKMHFKTGSNSAGKGRTSVRKAVILRFLAGASEEEFQTFLDLAFDVILGHIDGTALDIVNRSRDGLDLKNVVPLNRLQGALTTMENIIERIANRMTIKKSLLLKVIIYIANLSSLILERRSEIKKRHVSFLKHIRQQAQKQIVNYFALLEDYKWQMEEIDAVFETMVWPNLKRLPDEGLLSPVPLLNLFECWAEIPRYFPLLAKVHKEDDTLTPLTYIVKLVSSEKCSSKVRTVVFGMVEKLLTLKDHEESTLNEKGEALPLIVCTPVVEVKRLISRDGLTQQNYGSALLVPHLSGLLQSMKILVTNLSKGIKVSQRDLTILSSLTEWVTDKNISEELLTLTIPLIVNKHVKKAEIVAQLLTTCSYLLPVIDNSKQFLRPLVSQFGCLVDRASRDALCKAIAAIASVNSEYKEIADLAANLNSWNPKFVDVVDYDRRLDGYRQLSDYCKSAENISIDYCQFLVYNCMYVILHVHDTSLRDMSRLCLDQFIDMCVRLEPTQPSEVKQVLIDRLLSLVRNGLRDPKDEVRNDIFFVLQKIVHKCHSLYDKLKDLHKIADEVDDDADFFSNMMHIQRHRRSRAMMRLSDKLKSGSVVLSVETITEYLLPALKVYLFNDTYAKDDHLVQAAIRCIGAFALLLPWHSYMRMLKAYLSMFKKIDIKYLKVLVKILEFMIDGFHEEVEEVVILEKESKNIKENIEGIGSGDKLVSEEGALIKSEESVAKAAKKMCGKEGEKVIEGKTDLKEFEHADLPLMADEDLLTRPQKIYLALVNNIIPQLKKTLVGRTRSDSKHKVNKGKYPEDDDIKRIPLAFALIKLMKKLPPKVLDSNVNSILMKMMTFLKSQSQPIRDEARNMLVKIMTELGGKYLPWLVSDLRSILTRGFQTHVLVFTLHSVLSQIRPLLRGTDIDSCLVDMIEICKEDILGLQSEEKKVAKITTKVKEARNDKSYAILNFTAEFVSAQALAELLMPLKEVLASTQDRKIVNKIIKCMDDIASGIEKNENITLTQKSVFIYGILNEKLGLLTGNGKKTNSEGNTEKIQHPDCYLLEPEPKKARLVPKTTFETTSFVFIEFALKLLASLLRREKFNPQDEEHLKLLDPYLGVMGKCLKSEHPDISMHALKCITLLVKYPLPSLKKHLADVSSEMFVILHKFSSSELARGKVYELLQLTFRTLAFIIKNVQIYTMTSEQVRVLLQYVQESLDDSSHQTVVFAVLQAVLARKIDAPELHELMGTVKKMSIVCTRQYALNQARVTYYSYLLTYPMKKKKLIAEILYYLGNVSYSIEDGRLSAQMFINGVITNFPVKIFTKELETNFWLKISEQIVKEQCKENRTLLHKSLKTLFERSERKSYLIDLCLKLLGDDDDENIESCAVAIQLSCKSLSAFLDVSIKKLPKTMISEVAPKIVSLLNPSKFSAQMKGSSLQDDVLCNEPAVSQLQEVDNALVLLMEVLTKLGSLYLTSSEWSEHVDDSMWVNIQSLLFYPHIQIRLSSTSLIGQLLAAYPVEGVKVPVVCSTTDKARSLVLDLCEVLQTQAETEVATMMQLSLAVVRNLIYLIRNSCRVSLNKPKVIDEGENEVNFENTIKETQDAGENIEENKDPLVLGALWVIRHVGDIAYKELMVSGKDYTVVREALLNLIAGVIVVVGEKLVSPNLLSYIIKHLARELSDDRLSEKLINCTQEVANLVKDHVGVELYTRYFTAAQVSLSKKRLERKAHEQQQRLVDPQRFNKKRKKKRLARAVSKKVALAEKKGKVMSKTKIAKLRASAFATE